ncbi:MAG: TatD family hydrolase [Pseudomonadota bacterium]
MPTATNTLIDTHCHLDFSEFDQDRDQVIKQAAASGVTTIIVPAVTQATWPRTIETCRTQTGQHGVRLLLALGMHPMFIEQHQPQHLTELDQVIEQHQPIAVGEIGLDFYSTDADHDKQTAYFTKQLIIAKRHDLPVIIHNRKAHDQCISLLREHQPRGGIVHAFNGSLQQAEKYIEMRFLLGFGGMLTFERSRKLRALAEALPLQSIVLETDAPDMTVSQHRGERNSPEYLPYVMEALAEIKNMAASQVAETSCQNVLRVFGVDEHKHRANPEQTE